VDNGHHISQSEAQLPATRTAGSISYPWDEEFTTGPAVPGTLGRESPGD